MRQYNNYISPAPPLVGGYGGYGYGGGGLSIFPSYGVPLFYGGGIFNFFIFMVRVCSTFTGNADANCPECQIQCAVCSEAACQC